MAFPADPLDVKVELAIGADIHADPSTWSFTDVTTKIREKQKVGINRGRRNRIGYFPPTRVSATADNTDGNLCRHNPLSAYFGQLKKNTPIKVSVNNGSGYVTRAAAYVTGFPPSWDPSEQDQTVTLEAAGITDRLGRSRQLRSALFRSMVGVAEGDYVPHAYWPMEDGSSATRFASPLVDGPAMTFSGDVTLASDSDLPGSDALPVFASGSAARFTVPSYTDTDKWIIQAVIRLSASTTIWDLTTDGTGRRIVVAYNSSGPSFDVDIYDSSGSSVYSGDLSITSDAIGPWLSVGFSYRGDTATDQFNFTYQVIGTNVQPGFGDLVSGRYGRIVSGTFMSGLSGDASAGHMVIFTDANFSHGIDDVYHARAANGWAGEEAHERVERLCREERVPVTTAATTSQAMGPQRSARLLDLLRECAEADVGLLYENMNFGLTFVSAAERYNLGAAITLDYAAGEILPPWEPTDDDQDYTNDVVATRPDGSPQRVADEDEIDDVGAYGSPFSPNVETDDQARDVAGFRLNLGLNDELTWPAVRPKVITGGALLDDWLATDLGLQMHITGHPSPLAPDTIRQVIEGYTETLGSFTYDVSVNLSPASPWDVLELDDDTLSKLDTAGCELSAAATSGVTSLSVHTTVLPKWTTDVAEMPIPILVSGQVNSVTSIANVSPSFIGAGTVAHGNNASVSPSLHASTAAGDLVVVFAAIRNSGTGTVNTPSGYTTLLEFGNAKLMAKYAASGEAAPTVTFTGGVANADTSAQAATFRGVGRTVHASAALLNSSAQNITYPALDMSRANCVVLYLGWKQDDWTSVTGPGTEIGEPDTTTGDDHGIVWAYTIQTTATAIASGSFTVTGGVSAISRGAVVALGTDVQTMTVTRGTNGVTKALAAGDAVTVYQPARLAL